MPFSALTLRTYFSLFLYT